MDALPRMYEYRYQVFNFISNFGIDMKAKAPMSMGSDRMIRVELQGSNEGTFQFVTFYSYMSKKYLSVENGKVVGKEKEDSANVFKIKKSLGPTTIQHAKSGLYLRILGKERMQCTNDSYRATEFNHVVNSPLKKIDESKVPFKGANFTKEHLIHFREHGYIRIPNAIPQKVLEDALRLINRGICFGRHGPRDEEEDGRKSGGLGKFDKELQWSGEITDLITKTKAWRLIQRLLGEGTFDPPSAGQIALRYPAPKEAQPKLALTHWHIDGLSDGCPNFFSLLVGFALSPTPTPFTGNFTVFEGSHMSLSKEYRDLGKEAFLKLYQKPRKVGEPKQLLTKPGDLLLVHPMLAHRGGPNHGVNIRYAVYFRVTKKDKNAAICDPFCEYPIMKTVLGESKE
ncbi:hypothetical protein AAMO2058_000925400 [Amorphochlora amoebiformis]